MNGKDVFQFAVRKVPQVIQEVLKENKLSAKDIDWFVLHQANARIVACSCKTASSGYWKVSNESSGLWKYLIGKYSDLVERTRIQMVS